MENNSLISIQEYRNKLTSIVEEKLGYTYHYCTVAAEVKHDGKLICRTYISSKIDTWGLDGKEFKFNCEASSFDEIIQRLEKEIEWKQTEWKETEIYVNDNTNL